MSPAVVKCWLWHLNDVEFQMFAFSGMNPDSGKDSFCIFIMFLLLSVTFNGTILMVVFFFIFWKPSGFRLSVLDKDF